MKPIRSFVLIALLGTFTSFSPVEEEIDWISFEEAIELNKQNPKKILIDIYTDWCGWCKRMDKDTYSKSEIVKAVNEHFYPVKLNAEQRESIDFSGHTFKFMVQGRRGVHELAAALTQNKLSYPTTVFMDEEVRIIQPLPGYMKADQLLPILLYIGKDHFKDMTWEAYQEAYNQDS